MALVGPQRSSRIKADAESASDIAHGQTTITVVVKQPKVEHKVRMRDFERGLNRAAFAGREGL
jgi:hypothetical protein